MGKKKNPFDLDDWIEYTIRSAERSRRRHEEQVQAMDFMLGDSYRHYHHLPY